MEVEWATQEPPEPPALGTFMEAAWRRRDESGTPVWSVSSSLPSPRMQPQMSALLTSPVQKPRAVASLGKNAAISQAG